MSRGGIEPDPGETGRQARHRAVAAAALAALGMTIVGGYVAPLVLPIVPIPLIGQWMVADMAKRDADAETISEAEPTEV